MDSDGTHKPIYILKMLRYISNGYDIISTTRFKKKNSLRDWSFLRKKLTIIRYLLVNILLGTKLDSSGAYRCYNLKRIQYRHFFISKNNSYFFLIESLFFFEKLNYKIKEFPVTLRKRVYESSKIRLKDILNSFKSLLILFCNKNLKKI